MSSQATSFKIVVSSGKRKTSVAVATIKPGKGRVWVNNVTLEALPIELARMKISEPLMLIGELRNTIDIRVRVRGGGWMSQAEAARIAIARGIVEFFGLEEIKKIYREYDRHMLSGDPRQTEPEKWGRISARRRWQKSYR
jgi:small subunit ribosomal protein S9